MYFFILADNLVIHITKLIGFSKPPKKAIRVGVPIRPPKRTLEKGPQKGPQKLKSLAISMIARLSKIVGGLDETKFRVSKL